MCISKAIIISDDTAEDVWIILDPPFPLASLGELEESEEHECDASVDDCECDDCYDCDVDEEECMVEEALLEKSHEEIMHEVNVDVIFFNICSPILLLVNLAPFSPCISF